ncbi:hypothetical protein VHUM_01833 [Vanrija humicola]|uniref:non-specific serine/threonine protein kinase n=1 Tax=Vanrija humicola TaxID=5417 RepID=A0A7D8ZAW6_VANHU|nr:hypothetical protein VHUM_01833 [Vanrija humicola]
MVLPRRVSETLGLKAGSTTHAGGTSDSSLSTDDALHHHDHDRAAQQGQNGEPRTLFGLIDSRRPSVYPDHLVTEAEGVSRPVVAAVARQEPVTESSTAHTASSHVPGPSASSSTALDGGTALEAAALAPVGEPTDEYPNGTVRTKRPRVINKLSLDLALVPPQTPPSSTPNSPSPAGGSHASTSRTSSRTQSAPRPALETLERASCAALYFEQYYHNLTKPDAKRQLLRRDTVDINHFEIGRVIGQGAFGVVRIASEASRPDSRLVAIKQLRKSDLLKMGQEGHIRAERDLLTSAAIGVDTRPSWILRLFHAFQDKDSLYLVLEFMGGGDLLTLLMERISLPEAVVRFYAAEMILALQQVHALGYIHRDVKPDNFLFTSDGHIRIADFGLATDLHWSHDSAYYEQQRRTILKRHGFDLSRPAFGNRKRRTGNEQTGGSAVGSLREKSRSLLGLKAKSRRRLAYTICGALLTPAPEVIRGQGYGFGVDWWSLGVILYEAMIGSAPFIGNSVGRARARCTRSCSHSSSDTKPASKCKLGGPGTRLTPASSGRTTSSSRPSRMSRTLVSTLSDSCCARPRTAWGRPQVCVATTR